MQNTCTLKSGGSSVDEEIKKKLYNDVENPWEFVIEASKEYKKEFRKTAKIGEPPNIDDILEKIIEEKKEKENKKNKKKSKSKKKRKRRNS